MSIAFWLTLSFCPKKSLGLHFCHHFRRELSHGRPFKRLRMLDCWWRKRPWLVWMSWNSRTPRDAVPKGRRPKVGNQCVIWTNIMNPLDWRKIIDRWWMFSNAMFVLSKGQMRAILISWNLSRLGPMLRENGNWREKGVGQWTSSQKINGAQKLQWIVGMDKSTRESHSGKGQAHYQ